MTARGYTDHETLVLKLVSLSLLSLDVATLSTLVRWCVDL